ncbi:MAG: 2OG-Fe(II) oxygenase [Alphaproteobacteria bacterium]
MSGLVMDREDVRAAPAALLSEFDAMVARSLPIARLNAEKTTLREQFEAGQPYPNLVLDDLFDGEVLDRVLAEFPGGNGRDWVTWDNENEIKQTSRGITGLPLFTQFLLLQLSSEPFLEVIRSITGMDDLVWDPLFHGAGLHESRRGGWLNLHADWTKHPVLPLRRRLNLIIYLNRDWQEEWGGALDLVDFETRKVGTSVPPLYNRMVLFPTTEETLHGFPTPITCPPDQTRRSISVYYWSADRDAVKTAQSINFLPGGGTTKRTAFIRSLIPPVALARLEQIRDRLRRR